MSDPTPDRLAAAAAELRRFLPVLAGSGPDPVVIEVRALGVPTGRGYTADECGFFELSPADPWDSAKPLRDVLRALLARAPGDQPEGVYATLNPVHPALLARANGRLKRPTGKRALSATDKDIAGRRLLLVDVDPVRPAGVSATDAEKAEALAVAGRVEADLTARGWPAPVRVDSGNGYHLWYRVDLPADDAGLVKRCLQALAARHDTAAATVDASVFNPGRIAKLPGTWARKGDDTPARPHRMARVTDVPDSFAVVPTPSVEALAAAPPAAEPARVRAPTGPAVPATGYASRLDVAKWLAARNVSFRKKDHPEGRGRTVYRLSECPFDPSHAGRDACVMQDADGALSAHCFHASCRGRGWQEFKAKIGKPDPDHYDPPMRGRRPGPRTRPAPPSSGRPTPPSSGGPPDEKNPAGPGADPPQQTVTIDPLCLSVADTMRAITDVLQAAGDCFRRADQVVRVAGPAIAPVLSAPELAGLLNRHAEVLVASEDGTTFRPLPTAYANTWLNHPVETARLPAITLFTLNPVYTTDWRIAPPGFDLASGIYSAGPAVEPRAGTARLDALLADFCFRTPGDRTNYIGVLLTALLVPHFVGAKPAVLFNGNQPGLGKSILAQVVALLREGRPAETATYNPNDEEFEKRLGAIVRRGATTIVIDNAKAGGRNPRIDSAVLERSITDPVLSFRLLGHSREIRAENSHIFCLTANSPDISRDLVTRCVVVNLYYEGDPVRRTFTLPDPEAYTQEFRVELLGELAGMVERWRAEGSPRAAAHSRFNKKGWGPIVGGILAANAQPDFLANAARAAEELDETRRDFADLVAALVDHSQGTWTGSELAARATREGLFAAEFRDASARAAATRMGILAGRFVGERFPLSDGRSAVFGRTTDRKGTVYRVAVEEPPTG